MGSQAFFQKKSSLLAQGFKHDRGRNPYADVALLHDLVTIEFIDEIGHQTPISNGCTVVGMEEKTAITYDACTIIKAFAVLAMIFHHCFGFIGWYVEAPSYLDNHLLLMLSRYANICVHIFAFLTGWTYYHHKDKSIRYSIKKISIFLVDYWIVVIPMCIFAYFCCGYSFSSGTLGEFFPVNRHPLMIFAWYVCFYILMMLIFPLFSLIENQKHRVLSYTLFSLLIGCVFWCSYSMKNLHMTCICSYFPCAMYGYFVFPCAMCGYFVAKFNVFEFFMRRTKHKLIYSIVCLALLGYVIHFYGVGLSIITPFLILSILPLIYSTIVERLRSIFLCIGRHSMNIWFIHCIFFSAITRDVIQSIFFPIDNPVWIFSVVLLTSLFISFIITPVQEYAKMKISAAFFQK